ncbi:uncharacterized protein [Rutidosis leptorrhynchoides]|uniref:uncharacterized protein isoform X2 n=1 Tax=Rutidosis leptorrhynchoides TaxID=125765 RepID=UPI003A98EF72
MSRRDSDSRHHRSRFDREPSPKRVRRDAKTATERTASKLNDHNDRDQKHHRKLKDSFAADTYVVPGSKIETAALSKEPAKKTNVYRDGTKNSSANIEAHRSRSRFQHDERAGQGRSFRHRETAEREGRKDSRDQQSGRATNRSSTIDAKLRDDKTRFDGTELDLKQTSNRRRSFRETKIPVDVSTGDKSATQVSKIPEGNERKEERGKPIEKPPMDRPNRRISGERDPQRNEMHSKKFESRERYGGGNFGGSFRGRDNERQGHSGGRADKWKHDLYDEANKSPTSKNEEDQIAKVEALLAS